MDVNKIYNVDCLDGMKELEDNSVDLIVTDPPYGYSFMGKDWDKAVPSVDIWKEALRVLKSGAFAFVMCAPRQDVSILQMSTMQQAGFRLDFSPIYWAYAEGFPKATNIGKKVDKRFKKRMEYFELAEHIKNARNKTKLSINKVAEIGKFYGKVNHGGSVSNWETGKSVPTLGQWKKLKAILNLSNKYDWLIEQETKRYEEAKREVIGKDNRQYNYASFDFGREWDITIPATQKAKSLQGSYAGFQPKPAVEVILIAMKPLSKKTYVDQALVNEKGVTWLDDCRIPSEILKARWAGRKDKTAVGGEIGEGGGHLKRIWSEENIKGRFPANLLVSQDVLDDGTITHSNGGEANTEKGATNIYNFGSGIYKSGNHYEDSGGFSRYFNVDKWFRDAIKRLPKDVLKTYPFLIVPKASKSEKNKGCENLEEKNRSHNNKIMGESDSFKTGAGNERTTKFRNNHPTVKPIKLMSYLITLGSRQGDIILDPFIGSGTTAIAARILSRKFIGFEKEPEYYRIAEARIKPFMSQTKLGASEFEQTANCMSEM